MVTLREAAEVRSTKMTCMAWRMRPYSGRLARPSAFATNDGGDRGSSAVSTKPSN
eukprot:CAMPEP_0183464988 /NCGR_PEP_ID=MMETSP0370-20130417/146455_1 /TAXON_ID=268820 /ORGANISM="Peridinium aciculiferum, Strain PAER-2" /LENGTH=54 /DNA_ID=CAMNT_0025657171 /DNA_START=101 /DNA_END=262 /DNA_ORIENTATION=-